MEYWGSSDQEDNRIVHVREALMCPSGGCVPSLRTARFLNHTITAIDDDVFELPVDAFSFRLEKFEPEKWPVRFSFSGWGSPSETWIEWVNAMAESHAPTWRKSGVHDAIVASRYNVKMHKDLMMALVEKWCKETNTFVFPWGEATVTLEDMIVLGGFSTIGNYALVSIKREDLKSVEEKLKNAKREIRAYSGKQCCVSLWMKKFMNSDSEIEHEAFIVTWLSRFVFPDSADLVRDKLFPAAVQLARGVRLALAPAVLAGIYRDLGILKEKLASYAQFGNVEEERVVVNSPLQFVQVWAWERIIEVRQGLAMAPNPLELGEPRMARWHHKHHHRGEELYVSVENLRAVLDSTEESFDYRPYAKPLKNFKFPKFYLENDCWVSVHPHLDEDIISFARCLRFSKLVGMDCIESYYPHRVAMQFGFDQDVPGNVPTRAETPELGWKNYIRPISDDMLYMPSRLYEADVTFRYIGWWKQSIASLQEAAMKSAKKAPPHSLLKEKEKPVTTMTTPTTTASSSSGRSKTTTGAKVTANSRTAVKRVKANSEGYESLMGSEQAAKQSKGDGKALQRKGMEKTSPALTRRPRGLSINDAKDLKGALKGSGETKNNNHVKFLLPSSPGSTPKLQTQPPKQSTKGSPVSTSKTLPPRQTSSVSSKGGKNDAKNADTRPAREVASTKNQTTKEPSHCPGSRPLGRVKSTKSLEAEKSNESSVVKQKAKQNRGTKVESSKDTQVASGANAKNLLDQMAKVQEHVGERVDTYEISKSQFEALNQGFQEVLMELQTIKSALNIKEQ